jgi:universal stress protein A
LSFAISIKSLPPGTVRPIRSRGNAMSTNELIDPVCVYLAAESEVRAELTGGSDSTAALAALKRADDSLQARLSTPLPPNEQPLAKAAERYLDSRTRHADADDYMVGREQVSRECDVARRELDEQLRRSATPGEDAGADDESPTLHRKRVLIAVDDSRPSEWAVQVGGELARDLWARVMLVHVVVPALELMDLPGAAEEANREQGKLGDALLERAVAALPQGVAAGRCLCEGVPAREIGLIARTWRPDLIVMGTWGRGRLSHFLLGSTADDVIRNAGCPVVTVSHEPEPTRRRRTVTTASPRSRVAEPALATA